MTVAESLIQKIAAEEQVLSERTFGTSFDDLRNQYFDFEEYKVSTKSKLTALLVRAFATLIAYVLFIVLNIS